MGGTVGEVNSKVKNTAAVEGLPKAAKFKVKSKKYLTFLIRIEVPYMSKSFGREDRKGGAKNAERIAKEERRATARARRMNLNTKLSTLNN